MYPVSFWLLTILYYNKIYCIIIVNIHIISHNYIILHHITSYYIILHHITSYYIILHHITSYYITYFSDMFASLVSDGGLWWIASCSQSEDVTFDLVTSDWLCTSSCAAGRRQLEAKPGMTCGCLVVVCGSMDIWISMESYALSSTWDGILHILTQHLYRCDMRSVYKNQLQLNMLIILW